MDIKKTLEVLNRLLDQTEYSIEYNQKTIADRLQKIYLEALEDNNQAHYTDGEALDHVLLEIKDLSRIIRPEERMIRYTEEIEAIKQAIRNTQRQKEYEDWTNKNF